MPFFKLRVDRSGAEISRISDLDSETKVVTLQISTFSDPQLKKIKAHETKRAKKKNAKRKKVINLRIHQKTN
jgi:hypothetical protein